MTAFDPALARNICKQCGKSQLDGGVQAPMFHVGAPGVPLTAMTSEHVHSYHYDCLPYEVEAQHMAQHGEGIQAAKDGLRAEELHAVIQKAATKFRAAHAKALEEEKQRYLKSDDGKADVAYRRAVGA